MFIYRHIQSYIFGHKDLIRNFISLIFKCHNFVITLHFKVPNKFIESMYRNICFFNVNSIPQQHQYSSLLCFALLFCCFAPMLVSKPLCYSSQFSSSCVRSYDRPLFNNCVKQYAKIRVRLQLLSITAHFALKKKSVSRDVSATTQMLRCC